MYARVFALLVYLWLHGTAYSAVESHIASHKLSSPSLFFFLFFWLFFFLPNKTTAMVSQLSVWILMPDVDFPCLWYTVKKQKNSVSYPNSLPVFISTQLAIRNVLFKTWYRSNRYLLLLCRTRFALLISQLMITTVLSSGYMELWL